MSALALAVPVPGLAQDAGTAQNRAPDLRYVSAFADYSPYKELAPADWRAVNDAVGHAAQKAGSHAAIPGAPTAAATTAPAAAPGGKPAMHSNPLGMDVPGNHGAHGGMK